LFGAQLWELIRNAILNHKIIHFTKIQKTCLIFSSNLIYKIRKMWFCNGCKDYGAHIYARTWRDGWLYTSYPCREHICNLWRMPATSNTAHLGSWFFYSPCSSSFFLSTLPSQQLWLPYMWSTLISSTFSYTFREQLRMMKRKRGDLPRTFWLFLQAMSSMWYTWVMIERPSTSRK
jgi:hypothetical protein